MKQGRKPFVYSEMGERFSGEREWRGTRQTFPIPLNKTKPEGKTSRLSRWFRSFKTNLPRIIPLARNERLLVRECMELIFLWLPI